MATTTTDRQGAGPARPRIAPPRIHATVAGTLATFLLALAVLAWQMASGRDPVLGHGFEAKAAPPREVVVRRVVITRVQQAHVVEVRRVRHSRHAKTQVAAAAPPPVVRTVSAPKPAAAPKPTAAPKPKPAPAPEPAAAPAEPAPPTSHQS